MNNRYTQRVKFGSLSKTTTADYELSKAITPATKRVEFREYCEFYNLDPEEEKLNRETQFSKKFNW